MRLHCKPLHCKGGGSAPAQAQALLPLTSHEANLDSPPSCLPALSKQMASTGGCLGWLLQATAIQDPHYEKKIHQWCACTDWLASQMQVLTARPWQAIYTRHVIIPPCMLLQQADGTGCDHSTDITCSRIMHPHHSYSTKLGCQKPTIHQQPPVGLPATPRRSTSPSTA